MKSRSNGLAYYWTTLWNFIDSVQNKGASGIKWKQRCVKGHNFLFIFHWRSNVSNEDQLWSSLSYCSRILLFMWYKIWYLIHSLTPFWSYRCVFDITNFFLNFKIILNISCTLIPPLKSLYQSSLGFLHEHHRIARLSNPGVEHQVSRNPLSLVE
jgi:hypothetical protein